MPLRVLFVMDPIADIRIEGDSTFVLMLEAQRRGHEVLYALPRDLSLRGAVPWCDAWSVTVERRPGGHYQLGPRAALCLNELDAVFMRKDPPVDMRYITATHILDRVDRSRVVLVNDSRGLRDFNEKLAALYWPDLIPRTLVTSSATDVRAFLEEVGTIVVKPLLGSGGAGVVKFGPDDDNFGSVLDLLTEDGRTHVEAQAYLPAVKQGDKRIILLEGEPLGVINRRPRANDLRANMHAGGAAEPATLEARDYEICAALKPELVRRGLVFTGIDVIGGYLTEINVTSPTGLQEIGRFDGRSLEADIIDWVEGRRSTLRS